MCTPGSVTVVTYGGSVGPQSQRVGTLQEYEGSHRPNPGETIFSTNRRTLRERGRPGCSSKEFSTSLKVKLRVREVEEEKQEEMGQRKKETLESFETLRGGQGGKKGR